MCNSTVTMYQELKESKENLKSNINLQMNKLQDCAMKTYEFITVYKVPSKIQQLQELLEDLKEITG